MLVTFYESSNTKPQHSKSVPKASSHLLSQKQRASAATNGSFSESPISASAIASSNVESTAEAVAPSSSNSDGAEVESATGEAINGGERIVRNGERAHDEDEKYNAESDQSED